MPIPVKDDRIALVMDSMRQLLDIQSSRTSWQISSKMQMLQRFDLTSSCGEHEDCANHLQLIWAAIAVHYPGCRSRRYVKSTGEVFFIVLSEFGELSPRLGIAYSECQAWSAALTTHCLGSS